MQPTLAAARGVLAKLYMQNGQYQEAIDQCRKALANDPKDQTAVYRLIQALRKTGQKQEIPELLQRLAQLREQATKDERERYRYKLFEEGPSTKRGATKAAISFSWFSPGVRENVYCLWTSGDNWPCVTLEREGNQPE